MKRHEPKPRVLTGLMALDDLLGGGLRPDRVTVVAARTSMGKSMLALTMARNCAFRQGRRAQVASLEMSKEGLLERTLAAETGVPTEKIRRRTLDPSELDLQKEVAGVVTDLQELATRLEAAVVIVEQLTRAPELRHDHRY